MLLCDYCIVGFSCKDFNLAIGLTLELKQISEISGYPFEIYYPDTDLEPFRIVANYFKQV